MNSGIRLRTFSPGSTGQDEPSAEELARAALRDAGYQSGFAEGHAAATEAHLEDQTRLTAALVEALEDAALTNEAARRHVAASLSPMIEALVRAITPALAEAGLSREVARLVAEALEASPGAVPQLRCAPELSEELGRILAERGLGARIEAAAELLPREVTIAWDQGFDHIDLDACIARIGDCIASHLTRETGSDAGE
jgi:flagellar biosynthesis/type III secretory pathway protein FliH